MLSEVDDGLRSLIAREAIDATRVSVVFDAPTKDWAARRSGAAVNLYLYDIREEIASRLSGQLPVRDGDGRVIERRPHPRRFHLSYLVTAWTSRPEEEHRLLNDVLKVLLGHDMMPSSDLTGELAELGLPVPLTVGAPASQERSISDIWSALGGELKPSLDVVVSAAIAAGRPAAAGPPVLEPLHVRAHELER
jgi:hypothetical protein